MATFNPRRTRALILIAFGLACLGVIGVLLALTGMHLSRPYQVSVTATDADNLVERGRVRVAGIVVGSVETTEVTPAGAKAVISLFPEYAPLHQGATVRVGNRSLVEETYLDLRDGTGPEIPTGSALPAGAVQTSTQLRDVLHSLDQDTRGQLSALMRSAGAATVGTGEQVGQVLAGLGKLGREGNTAIDAIAAQGEDLRALTRDTTVILGALDTGQGQIASMVDNADRLTAASASQRGAIEGAMRRLPGVLDSAHTAADELSVLSAALHPVARDLRASGPRLRSALDELPAVSARLRGLLPPLDAVLDKAPPTFDRVPEFGDDMREHLIPRSRDLLQDVNPMTGYLKPYGPEIGAFLANFNAILNYKDEAGTHYWRTFLPLNDSSVTTPAKLGVLTYYNPLPRPGAGGNPGPFTGKFPRIERQPR